MSHNEDIRQEHALLNRVLLIYEEAAQIIQHFIERYHEKLEEDHVFPLSLPAIRRSPFSVFDSLTRWPIESGRPV